MAGGDGEGATEFHDYEGGGIGEGEGTKDVSDKIENEEQVMRLPWRQQLGQRVQTGHAACRLLGVFLS